MLVLMEMVLVEVMHVHLGKPMERMTESTSVAMHSGTALIPRDDRGRFSMSKHGLLLVAVALLPFTAALPLFRAAALALVLTMTRPAASQTSQKAARPPLQTAPPLPDGTCTQKGMHRA